MGAFSVIRGLNEESRERAGAKAASSFQAQGFARFRSMAGVDYCLDIYKNLSDSYPAFYDSEDDGEFCAVAGTLVYRGLRGDDAARSIFQDFDGKDIPFAEALGSYCVILQKFDRLFLWIDRLGTYKAYVTRSRNVWSSSFLAALECDGEGALDVQSVYEYAFQGTTYGGRTLAKNVSLAEPECLYDIVNPDKSVAVSSWISDVPDCTNSDSLDLCLSSSRQVFEAIKSAGFPIVDSAISGGFDSRLMLALLLEQDIDARYHVYGDPECEDVLNAKWIGAELGLTVNHEDKSAQLDAPDDDRAMIVHQNHLMFDGAPTDGIFDDGSDANSRRRRAAGGALMLNGGGGEIFRNFFYLPDRSYKVSDVVSSFYSQYSASVCTEQFDESRYIASLRADIMNCLGAENEKLSRRQIEMIYPLFRLRYWMGRNNAINNRIGWAFTPFSEPTVIVPALGIPIADKNTGRLEAEMIRTMNSRLASCPSNYGYDFSADPPFAVRLKYAAAAMRPPWLRRRSYRIKQRLLPADANAHFQDTVLKPCMPRGLEEMQRFFVTCRIRDRSVLGRVATIEYLCQRGLVRSIE